MEYWNDRYKEEKTPTEDEESYEWFRTFEKLRPFLEENLPSTSGQPRVLHLGCGTSSLTADLLRLGYRHQCSIDFSPVAIDAMRARYGNVEPSLEWRVMDVRHMDFEEHSFDVAIDKGTLDSMLYGSLWDPAPEVRSNAKAYVDEVARVLRPGGRWLYVTYRQPHFLRPLLEREKVWKLEVETLQDSPGSFEYFGFVITKDSYLGNLSV